MADPRRGRGDALCQPIDQNPTGRVRGLQDSRSMLKHHLHQTETQIRALTMDFGQALVVLKAGGRVARAGWNGIGMWLVLQRPDLHSKMTLPYIYIEYPVGHRAYPSGSRVPWLASQTDLLADDWVDVTSASAVATAKTEPGIQTVE